MLPLPPTDGDSWNSQSTVAGRVAVVVMVFTEAARRADSAPSESDAGRVADAFAAAGVCEVWLFGSVARGESTESSDIDLVVVCADLNYAQRWDRKRELAILGEHISGLPRTFTAWSR